MEIVKFPNHQIRQSAPSPKGRRTRKRVRQKSKVTFTFDFSRPLRVSPWEKRVVSALSGN